MFSRTWSRFRFPIFISLLTLIWILSTRNYLPDPNVLSSAGSTLSQFLSAQLDSRASDRPRSSQRTGSKNSSQIFEQISKSIFPSTQANGFDQSWRLNNQMNFNRLMDCHLGSKLNCQPHDDHIILLGTVHFSRVAEGVFSKKAEFPSGEAIWADALLWALNQLKYPYLIIDDQNHHQTNIKLSKVYNLLNGHQNVKLVLGDYLSIPECIKNDQCLKTELNPTGIPDYKLFVFDGFGQDVGHPLGRRWHLTFYPRQDHHYSYIGLTIEHYCHKFGVIPASKRFNKIYILGKDRAYLHPPSPQLYPESMWRRITNQTGIEFTIGTFQQSKDHPQSEKDTLLDGILDIGSQTRDQFIHQIQYHRAVIGLGWPVQPSTPLEALCVGTPFINPVWVGRRSQPNRSKWHTQHPYLAHFDPPYVYNVQDHHEEDVLESIQMILKNPLEKGFIPEDMKSENYLKRIENLIRFDWKSLSVQQNQTQLTQTETNQRLLRQYKGLRM